MEISKWFASIGIIILVFSLGINQSFAVDIIYEPNGVTLRNNPTVCSIQPDDPNLTKNELEKFSIQTGSAIDDWEQHLKNKGGKSNWSNWEINHKNIKFENLDFDSVLDCDIVIIFSKTPPSLDLWGFLGLAMSDYDTGKTLIEIYYSIPELCDSGQRERDGNIIYIIQIPCYGDMMVSDQLGAVIRHEMGHGFGLGHYMSTDETVTLEWNKGLSPTPSIMVQTSYENSDELRIAPKDIEKLFDIYGNDGFVLNSEEKKNLILENPYHIDQKYLNFKNADYGFSFQYPDKWGVDYNVEVYDDFTGVLYITDKEETLNRSFEIGFYDKSVLSGSNDEKIFESFISNEKKYCNEFLSEDFEFDCEKLILLETKTQNGKNGKVYTLKSIWNDGTTNQIIHRNFIVSEDKVWEISGYGPLAPFLLTSDVMEHSINSFNIDRNNIQSTEYFESEKNEQSLTHSPEKEPVAIPVDSTQIPDWVRGNAGWWAQDAIGDSDFISGLQYLIKEGIMKIPDTPKTGDNESKEIPSWIKNNADWWSKGLITDSDFVKGIQYLVEQGIIEA